MHVSLTATERQALRARAHALEPVVLVGAGGLSAALLAEVSRALDDHELIKVRLPGLDRTGREAMAADLCAAVDAEDVQGIGHVRVLYRARAQEPAAPRRRKRAARQT